ncbi:MAG: methylmalonyl Co-A mutase-associated GTPase MeaB [Leptospiraceae bacterium]|nr:methylmalonyl Co-A mutase-associated GTPase MeaB [Leptospiraceae bacterium]
MNAIDLAQELKKGNRRALAKSVTLIESTLPKDRIEAEKLLALIKNSDSSIRIGITGVPGAGKSTFIESFGLYAISKGKKVAVLAVDPSSPVTGGSILGDKTRMPNLTMNENAFIRPSPSKGNLGGVAKQTSDTIKLCEASGYDIIIVETVGVGQSETAVSNMTDFFLLLLIAGAGDELQGIKKGIMEMADLILINKSDGENKTRAQRAKNECLNALSFSRNRKPFWTKDVLTISALYNEGIDLVWNEIHRYVLESKDYFFENRKNQSKQMFSITMKNKILEDIESMDLDEISEKFLLGNMTANNAKKEILKILTQNSI